MIAQGKFWVVTIGKVYMRFVPPAHGVQSVFPLCSQNPEHAHHFTDRDQALTVARALWHRRDAFARLDSSTRAFEGIVVNATTRRSARRVPISVLRFDVAEVKL